MAQITAKAVSDLRTKTGCGMMDCKKALVEANGDFDEAVKILREKGLSVAAKKADRIAAEGIVSIKRSDDGMTAAMIEVNSETDFVAKNESFREFVDGLLSVILANKPADIDALMTCQYLDTDMNVEAVLKDKIFTIGENMNIRRFLVVEGVMSTYIHGNGTTGVIVTFEADDVAKNNAGFDEMAKNIALQVAAMNPAYLDKEAVPASVIEEEKNILIQQIKNDEKNANKPQAIIEKMVMGRIGKYYDTNCLTEQAYVKSEDNQKVCQYVDACVKAFGGSIKILGFYKFEKGEGIQKKEDNFGEEIAKMINK